MIQALCPVCSQEEGKGREGKGGSRRDEKLSLMLLYHTTLFTLSEIGEGRGKQGGRYGSCWHFLVRRAMLSLDQRVCMEGSVMN